MCKSKSEYRISIESVFTKQDQVRWDIFEEKNPTRIILQLIFISVWTSAIYGFTMGIRYSMAQAAASIIKVPLLFAGTLLVCIPCLHFIGLLMGLRMKFCQNLALILHGIATSATLLAAFAPISIFFLLTGSRYNYMMMMHIGVFAFCGAAGLYKIHDNFKRITTFYNEQEKPRSITKLLNVWMLLYMYVGTQMSYVLMPFVGKDEVFKLFVRKDGNFYSLVWEIIKNAFS